MTQPNTTRRDLLRIGTSAAAYAAGAAIVAGGVALGGEAKGATSSASPALSDLMRQRAVADAHLDRFYETVFNPETVRCNRAVMAHRARIAAVPHVTEQGGESYSGKPIIFSSSNPASRGTADEYLTINRLSPNSGASWAATVAAAQRFVARDDARDARIKALGEEPQPPAWIAEAESKVAQPLDELDDKILTFPAATVADLNAKLAHIAFVGFEPPDLLEIIRSDVARIAGEA